jgi:hypothetical protein
MQTLVVDPLLWLSAEARPEERREADVAGGASWVVRESVRTAGAALSETPEGLLVEFTMAPEAAGDMLSTLHDSPCRCFVEATVATCGLPVDWREYARLDAELTVLDGDVDIEWALTGARSRLTDRRECRSGRVVLSVDTREVPLIQGKEPPWCPVALRLTARPAAGTKRSVVLHRISLVPGDAPAGHVLDGLGQRMHSQWPGKMKDKSELLGDLVAEKRALAALPPRRGRDRFGGWTGGPQFAPGRFFRVQQDDEGRWWYVDPLGNPYWSFGPTCVRLYDSTAVEGREELFEALPTRDHPGLWREDGSVCFHGTNALRKYGSEAAWVEFTCRRLASWGATGIGNWSERSIVESRMIPSTWDLTSKVGPAMLGNMADVFDARWAAAFGEYVKGRTAPLVSNPWFVGWFVDNEMGWHRPRLLDGPRDAAIRRVWLSVVRDRFADVSAFRSATSCACETWNDVACLDEAGLGDSETARGLRADLTARYAERYFSEVKRILKEADPNHLYMGCRFVRIRPQEAVVRAASVCDVVTVNAYSILPERDRFDEWHRLCGRPIQIGEHQYAQYGPYLPPPIWPSLTADERRCYFPEYVRVAATMPYCVGSHWFQYIDQAGTGRPSNGENMAIGWVDVVDRPHPEMIEAAREIGDNIYGWHADSR